MPLENPYCSVEDVQRETGNSDTDLISQFEDAINVASRWVEDYCRCEFLLKDYSSEAHTLSRKNAIGDTIYLPWPIITLTEVSTADNVMPADDYYYDVGARGIRLRSGSDWLTDPKPTSGAYSMQWNIVSTGYTEPIKVKGTFGYVTPPASVRLACTKIAAAFTHEKRRERVDLNGGRTSILDDRIPDDSMLLLKRYRRLVY